MALLQALGERDLVAERDSVHWLEPAPDGVESRLRARRAIVRARAKGPHDIYVVHVRSAPEGQVLGIAGTYNLTRTSRRDERDLRVHGDVATWAHGDSSHTYGLELALLEGDTLPDAARFDDAARFKTHIADLQRTGNWHGVGRRSFKLEPAVGELSVTRAGADLSIDAGGHIIVVPLPDSPPTRGGRFIVEKPRHRAAPGNWVTWSVDRVRQLEWFGDERMQWLKAVAYKALDGLELSLGALGSGPSAEELDEEFGDAVSPPVQDYPSPETGWPPAPLEPLLSPPLAHEGEWRSLENDPFVRHNPGLPAAFVTTFLRPDEDRKDSRVFVALWDPRQVELHMQSGTEEPESATGETGQGLIPRDQEHLERLLAGFNGAFQGSHGDYGMMADGVVYVPPRPYAATVAQLRDGSTAFGTWPERAPIPSGVQSLRQNLTPLVADAKLNPYGRIWWGGVPSDWEDDTRTVRSGLCLTREGFVAYFYGSSVDHEHLGRAMLGTRCTYGIHLDMNQGHTGLEFYRVDRVDRLPLLEGRLHPMWQTQGQVPGHPEFRFRGRRMIRSMRLMHFPRYIHRQTRDFFYLTLRHLIPGDSLQLRTVEGDEGRWRTAGLPQQGFPFALATTTIRPDPTRPETKVRVLQLDPKMLRVGSLTDGAPVLAVASATTGSVGLTLADGALHLGSKGTRLLSGEPHPTAGTVAAVGVCRGGIAYYAEVATARSPDRDGNLLAELMDRLGCSRRLFTNARPIIAIGGSRDLADHPVEPPPQSVALVRAEGPGARPFFPETPVLPRSQWYAIQKGTAPR